MDPKRETRRKLRKGGLSSYFRPSQAEMLGVRHDQLRWLIADGSLERVGRGLYRLTGEEVTEHHTLAAVCARVPRSIVCLLSALQVHGIGTSVPHEVWLAIPHKARAPRLPDVRVRLLRFSGASWTAGVDETIFEGVPALLTNPARTVVDCFRFERLVGREAAREALRDAWRQRLVTADSLERVLRALPSRRLRSLIEVMVP